MQRHLRRIVRLALPVWLAACSSQVSAEALERAEIVLLQPESVLQPRVPDVQSLANYIDKATAQAAQVARQAQAGPPTSGFLVLAIRPGLRSNVWLDFQPPLPAAVAEALVRAMRAVTPPSVRGGPVVLAVKAGLWGGSAPGRDFPAPKEWRAAMDKAGRPLGPDILAERTWIP